MARHKQCQSLGEVAMQTQPPRMNARHASPQSKANPNATSTRQLAPEYYRPVHKLELVFDQTTFCGFK